MIDIFDPKLSDKIRTALRYADQKGKLSVVAEVVGIHGGVVKLRRIMNSEGDILIGDRAVLAVHMDI